MIQYSLKFHIYKLIATIYDIQGGPKEVTQLDQYNSKGSKRHNQKQKQSYFSFRQQNESQTISGHFFWPTLYTLFSNHIFVICEYLL